MKHSHVRIKLFNLFVAGTAIYVACSGCASMPPPNQWFSGNPNGGTKEGGLARSVSSASQGISGQVKTMGSAMSSAMGKAKNFVTSPFSPSTDNSDPTSLANMPTDLGPEIWVAQGQLYESQGNFGKAMENYDKAHQKDPKSELVLLSIARLNSRQKKYSEAEKFYGQALLINPAASTYNELALTLKEQGRTPEAQTAVQKAIELEPANARFRNNLAGMLVATGNSAEAVSQLQSVFSSADANYNVAFIHFTNQNFAAAQQYLQVALQADPSMKRANDLLNYINTNPAAQTAVAAYQTANEIYRTAQGSATAQVPASNAVYQQQSPSVPAQSIAPPSNYAPNYSQNYATPSGGYPVSTPQTPSY